MGPLTQLIREMCMYISQELGVGHSEKVYQEALAAELRSRGYIVELERVVPIMYTPANHGSQVCIGYARLDILVRTPNLPPVIIELKSAASLSIPALKAQIQVYIKALRQDYPGITGVGVQFMQPGSKEVSVNERVQIVEDSDLPELVAENPNITINI
jgi:GxxExxY protein